MFIVNLIFTSLQVYIYLRIVSRSVLFLKINVVSLLIEFLVSAVILLHISYEF